MTGQNRGSVAVSYRMMITPFSQKYFKKIEKLAGKAILSETMARFEELMRSVFLDLEEERDTHQRLQK